MTGTHLWQLCLCTAVLFAQGERVEFTLASASNVNGAYPAYVSQVLGGEGFLTSSDGFTARTSRPSEFSLPKRGSDFATLSLPGGFRVEVRELGLTGSGRPVKQAVSYARPSGESYWTAVEEGYEEWVLVENATAEPVAQWEVRGASLQQRGEGVDIVDNSGIRRVRVTAPKAYDKAGSAKAWLSVQGQFIALYTEARGQALVDPIWTPANPLSTAREGHTATELLNGKVLVVGGYNTVILASGELYTPSTESTPGSWTATANLLHQGRYWHTATLLRSGKVLVVGGFGATGYLATAELYDPGTNAWTDAGSLSAPRALHSATLLPSGQVLVAGGDDGTSYLQGVEIYNPETGTWTTASPLATGRATHTATALDSGKVLVAGGVNDAGEIASAEFYDPGTGVWSDGGLLATARSKHTATLLLSGQVLIVGGRQSATSLSSAELYNPLTNSWTETASLSTPRAKHTATRLLTGQVLVVGGANPALVGSAELYTPESDAPATWRDAGSLTTPRESHTAAFLQRGDVFISGGHGATGTLASAQLYCVSGVCHCESSVCPTGCCNGTLCATRSFPSPCGPPGGPCTPSCDTNRANNCGPQGCQCGNGFACAQGQHCSGSPGSCVCDASSCSGCCDGQACTTRSFASPCAAPGSQCGSCDTNRANNCGPLGCQCGNGSACAAGQHCSGSPGSCICDASSCSGCCNGQTCTARSFPSPCAAPGQQCGSCDTIHANNCGPLGCQCGAGPACPSDAFCRSGYCACECGTYPACHVCTCEDVGPDQCGVYPDHCHPCCGLSMDWCPYCQRCSSDCPHCEPN